MRIQPPKKFRKKLNTEKNVKEYFLSHTMFWVTKDDYTGKYSYESINILDGLKRMMDSHRHPNLEFEMFISMFPYEYQIHARDIFLEYLLDHKMKNNIYG